MRFNYVFDISNLFTIHALFRLYFVLVFLVVVLLFMTYYNRTLTEEDISSCVLRDVTPCLPHIPLFTSRRIVDLLQRDLLSFTSDPWRDLQSAFSCYLQPGHLPGRRGSCVLCNSTDEGCTEKTQKEKGPAWEEVCDVYCLVHSALGPVWSTHVGNLVSSIKNIQVRLRGSLNGSAAEEIAPSKVQEKLPVSLISNETNETQSDRLAESFSLKVESSSVHVLLIVVPVGFGCMALSFLLALFLMGWVQMIKFEREMGISIRSDDQKNFTEMDGALQPLVFPDGGLSAEMFSAHGLKNGYTGKLAGELANPVTSAPQSRCARLSMANNEDDSQIQIALNISFTK